MRRSWALPTKVLSQNAEALGRMTQCRSLPDFLAAKVNWDQCALEDYAQEMRKLAEANISLLGRATATAGQPEQARLTTRGALRSAA